jgi:hypothetical protein
MVDINEFGLYQIDMELRQVLSSNGLQHVELLSLLGNTTSQQQMAQIIKSFGVQTIYHAGAYKHVPIVENNMIEGVRNNVMGRTSASWADGMETLDAWETCREPEVLVRAASQRMGLRRLVAKAAAACARRAIESAGGDAFFRAALDDLVAWCDFRLDIADATRKRSRMALRHDRRSDLAMSLAMQSAMDAVDSATSQTRTGREAHAAQACLVAIDSIRASAGWANGAVAEAAAGDLASLVRESIPTLSVLRAACSERVVS